DGADGARTRADASPPRGIGGAAARDALDARRGARARGEAAVRDAAGRTGAGLDDRADAGRLRLQEQRRAPRAGAGAGRVLRDLLHGAEPAGPAGPAVPDGLAAAHGGPAPRAVDAADPARAGG